MAVGAYVLQFQRGQAGARNLHDEARRVLQELADLESEASSDARDAGLDVAKLNGASVRVAEEQQGLDPTTTTILITIATELGAHAAKIIWDRVVWPRLERKFGVKAVGRAVK